jgi:hypothetical protein
MDSSIHQSTLLLSILTNYFQTQLRLDMLTKGDLEGNSRSGGGYAAPPLVASGMVTPPLWAPCGLLSPMTVTTHGGRVMI